MCPYFITFWRFWGEKNQKITKNRDFFAEMGENVPFWQFWSGEAGQNYLKLTYNLILPDLETRHRQAGEKERNPAWRDAL